MKTYLNFLIAGACASIMVLSGCKKNSTPAGGTGNGNAELRPVKMSYFDGANGQYPTVHHYTYNAQNNLTSYGPNENNNRLIGTSQVIHTSSSYDRISKTFYSYFTTIDMTEDGSIYETPLQLDIKSTITNTTLNNVQSFQLGTVRLSYTSGGRLEKTIESNGRNTTYRYDAKGNLEQVLYSELPVGSQPVGRTRVVALDDHPSPFSNVKAYDRASWPQSFLPETALAYCKNNPLQMVVERKDATTGAWKIVEQDDFTYTYNEQGYPARVVVDVTYFTAGQNNFKHTFEYTYR